jgi:hypothetical protein
VLDFSTLKSQGAAVLDHEQDALRVIVERLCQCEAKFRAVALVTLAGAGQPREVAVFELDGHPAKVGIAYAWNDRNERRSRNRVVMHVDEITSPEDAVRAFLKYDASLGAVDGDDILWHPKLT